MQLQRTFGPRVCANRRLYELPCGHEQELEMGCMRAGDFACKTCLGKNLRQEAEAQGCKLLGAGKNATYRMYELPCGHEQEVKVASMRSGGFRCSVCQEEKMHQEAEAQGCKLLASGRSYNHCLYALPCGHEQNVHTYAMREGVFICQICEETSRTQPSNVYLLHIKVDSDEWLKLGFAKSVDYRVSQYGLLEGAEVTTVDYVAFATGNEAHAVEANIHKRYKRKRFAAKHMKAFHTKGGFDECYPVTMLDTLLAAA